MTKMNKNLFRLLSNAEHQDTTNAVLLTTGALNPVHFGHVDFLERAKVEIEETYPNQKVIAGFMSPKTD